MLIGFLIGIVVGLVAGVCLGKEAWRNVENLVLAARVALQALEHPNDRQATGAAIDALAEAIERIENPKQEEKGDRTC